MARRKPKIALVEAESEPEIATPETQAEESAETALASRSEQVTGRPGVEERLMEVWAEVNQGFIEQALRTNQQQDYWDIFNCKRGAYQIYNGNADIYAPIVRNALMARSQRFTNQIFPQSGRCVEAIDENGDIPSGMVAMMEHYIRAARLRDIVIPPMIRSGDVEGQYNLYVSWSDHSATAVRRSSSKVKTTIEDIEVEIAGADDAVDDREEFEVRIAHPEFEVLADSDVMVLPVTAPTIAAAIARGGSVTVLRRWTAGMIDEAEELGWITAESAGVLHSAMSDGSTQDGNNVLRKHLDGAGIDRLGQEVQVYETWTNLEIDGKKQLCRAFFGGSPLILGCSLSPYWRPLPPVISAPVEKDPQMFKGNAPVGKVAGLQYAANDLLNEGLDSATMAILPVILTDPEKNPRTSSMVLDLAAVWETSPNDTKFAEFPPLYQHALGLVAQIENKIFQTLSVNAAMIAQQTGLATNRKLSQAEIAQEQQVDILSTAEAVSGLQAGVLDEILSWIQWLDHQYRDQDMTVRAFGPAGIRANMQQVPPLQIGNAISFRWFGVEAARNLAMLQQQIAAVNVVRGIPPQMYPGRQLDLAPFINNLMENAFGPRLAPLIFKDMREQLSMRPELEDSMLDQGFEVPVHPLDDDERHMQVHAQDLATKGDPHGVKRVHIQAHQAQRQQKTMMMAQQAMMAGAMGGGGGPPGMPGGPGMPGVPGGAGRGVPGTPRIGAQPTGGRPTMYAPPGAMHSDRMPAGGAVPMPRAARE